MTSLTVQRNALRRLLKGHLRTARAACSTARRTNLALRNFVRKPIAAHTWRLQHRVKRAERRRSTEEIPLVFVTTMRGQPIQLFNSLHALGDNGRLD